MASIFGPGAGVHTFSPLMGEGGVDLLIPKKFRRVLSRGMFRLGTDGLMFGAKFGARSKNKSIDQRSPTLR